MLKDLVYVITKESHSENALRDILTNHPEIKFVSLVGIDLAGNDTDEKIPIRLLLDDIPSFLKGAIQTDGSSVVLPIIATLNNAKVDMIADLDVNWFVDYNYEHIDDETGKPVGTLRIPCFLYHDSKACDSRSILKHAVDYFKKTLLDMFKKYPEILKPYGITVNDIDSLSLSSGTELEFWVKTPNDKAEVEELSTSQVLQEQYWTRTKGCVRTALEQSLLAMETCGLKPEMGHKEVGGVKAKLDTTGNLTHIMEQLELDWRFSDALQAADNELLVRTMVKEIFRRNGLDVTFMAKPIDGVAGSGEHTHVGVAMKLKDGKRINLFTATKKHYLSVIGYAAAMGILKNYEIINPFVSATNDSLRRLKPGFEAPICVVTSLGHSVEVPSRNRSVLLGLVRDSNSPLSTRFELRAPNPHTNTYLALAAMYMSVLDGVTYALTNKKTEDDLLAELSKKPEDSYDYLEKGRAYRTEKNIFEDFTEEQRKVFGKAPATVYENLLGFEKSPKKTAVLKADGVFTDLLLDSFKTGAKMRWETEIASRILSAYTDEVRSCKMLHDPSKASSMDIANYKKVVALKDAILKDTDSGKGLFTKIKEALAVNDYAKVSDLQIEIDADIDALREAYSVYTKNLLDI